MSNLELFHGILLWNNALLRYRSDKDAQQGELVYDLGQLSAVGLERLLQMLALVCFAALSPQTINSSKGISEPFVPA